MSDEVDGDHSGRGEQRTVWTSWPQSVVKVEVRRFMCQRCAGCAEEDTRGENACMGQKLVWSGGMSEDGMVRCVVSAPPKRSTGEGGSTKKVGGGMGPV